MAGDVNYYGKKSKNGMYFYLLNKVVPAMGLALYKISLRKQYSTKKKESVFVRVRTGDLPRVRRM